MTITIETSGMQEVEQLLKVLKSLNIKNINIKRHRQNDRQSSPKVTKG